MHQRLIGRTATVLLGLVALAGPVVPAHAAVDPTPVPSPVVDEAQATPQPPESDEPDPDSGQGDPGQGQDDSGDGEQVEGLPVTGAQVGGMVVFGGGLIAAGIAMVAVRRRGPIDPDVIGR